MICATRTFLHLSRRWRFRIANYFYVCFPSSDVANYWLIQTTSQKLNHRIRRASVLQILLIYDQLTRYTGNTAYIESIFTSQRNVYLSAKKIIFDMSQTSTPQTPNDGRFHSTRVSNANQHLSFIEIPRVRLVYLRYESNKLPILSTKINTSAPQTV